MFTVRALLALVVCTLSLVACGKKGASPESEMQGSASDTSGMSSPSADANSAPMGGGSTSMGSESGAMGSNGGTGVYGGGTGMYGASGAPQPQQGTGMGGTGTSSSSAPSTATTSPVTLSDAQIAKITETVHSGEVEQAKVAQKKAKNAKVKKFASQMMTQHTKSRQKGKTLAKKEELTPEESTVSSDLSTKAEQTLSSLNSAAGPDFDKAYMDAQVQQHQAVLDLIESQLLPNASNQDLKSELEEARSMVKGHLTEAKQIQQDLAEAPITGATSSSRSANKPQKSASASDMQQ